MEKVGEVADTFDCPICLDELKSPVSCSRCHQLFCSLCVRSANHQKSACPYCRLHNPNYQERKDVQQKMDNLPYVCPHNGCGFTGFYKQKSQHEKKICTFRPICCRFCKTILIKSQIMEHTLKEHRQKLEEELSSCVDVKVPRLLYLKNQLQKKKIQTPILSIDYQLQTRNSNGNLAKRGTTSLFYCKGAVQQPIDCGCNGYCGPNNGCLCSSCMELTLMKNGILPHTGLLFNQYGRLCRVDEKGKASCGMRLFHAGTEYCADSKYCKGCSHLNKGISRYEKVYK